MFAIKINQSNLQLLKESLRMNSDYLYKVIKQSLLKLQAKANQNELNREKLIPYIKTYQKDLTILKRKKELLIQVNLLVNIWRCYIKIRLPLLTMKFLK